MYLFSTAQVASTVVDLLHCFFPQHMDRLEREKAFFPGPGPLLMSALTIDDIVILLGSDRKASQVGTRPPVPAFSCHHSPCASI